MKAALTIAQRINLHAMIGGLPVKDTKSVRTAWGVMDKLDLDAEERRAIGYRLVALDEEGTQFAPRWEDQVSMAAKEVELTASEAAFLRSALEIAAAHGGLRPGPQRAWLEPLLNLFCPQGE